MNVEEKMYIAAYVEAIKGMYENGDFEDCENPDKKALEMIFKTLEVVKSKS